MDGQNKERKYFEIYENAIDMYASVDPETLKIIECNLTLAKKLGYSKKEIIGQKVYWLYPDKLLKQRRDCLTSFVNTPSIENQLVSLRKKDGHQLSVSLNVKAIQNAHGSILEYRFAWRDVSIHNIAEIDKQDYHIKKFYELQLEINTVLSEINDVIVFFNSNCIIEYISPAVEQMFGYSPSELIGLNVSILMPSTFREEHDGYVHNFITINKIKKIIGIGREVLGKTKNNKIVPIHLSVSEITEVPDIIFLGIIRDISDIKKARLLSKRYSNRLENKLDRSEELYKNLFENTLDSILIVDQNTRLVDCNEAAMRTLGFNFSPLSSQVLDLNSLITNEVDRFKFVETLQNNEFFEDYELNMLTVDNRKIKCTITATKIQNENSNNVEYFTILRDVTHKRILEEQANSTQKQKLVARLVNGIAHDFNNYLTIMVGYTQYLKSLQPKGEILNGLNEINASGLKAAHLVKQLFAFNRKKVSSHKQHINLVDLLESLKLIILKTLASNITLEYEFDDNLENIYADPIQIEEIILNLVFNSQDAVLNGGIISIGAKTIKIVRSEDLIKEVEITVSDTGTGIKDNIKNDIFTPYFTTKSKEKGTGLGLTMVKDLVNENNGSISFKSMIGIGTVFKLTFPVCQIDEMEKINSEIHISSSINDLTFLIVDDNFKIGSLLNKYFEKKSCICYVFYNPLRAFEFIRDGIDSVDVAILDVVMPYLGGNELAKRIKLYSPQTKTILMSGYPKDEELDKKLLSEGFFFIEKPINFQELEQLITSLF